MAAPTVERRLVITGLSTPDGKHQVITYSAGDPEGFTRWIPADDLDSEVQRMESSGYSVEDRRVAPSELSARLKAASDALGGTRPLADAMGVRVSAVRYAITNPEDTAGTTAREFDRLLHDLAGPPAPAAAPEEVLQGVTSDTPAPEFAQQEASTRPIPVAAVRTDGGTQVRVGLCQETVDEYADAMRAGAAFPPILVYHDGTEFWLSDGFHRLMAVVATGQTEILADVRPGARRDAIREGICANSLHGLRLSRADKRHAVEMVLADPDWRRRSDRSIAEVLLRRAVSHTHVAHVRRELFPEEPGPALPLAEQSGNVATPAASDAASGSAASEAAQAPPAPLNAALPSGPPASTSYPSERPAAPKRPRGTAIAAPDPDDKTPTLSVRHFAKACLAAIQTYARTAAGENLGKTQQAMEDIIAQHIQDALEAAAHAPLSRLEEVNNLSIRGDTIRGLEEPTR